MLVPSFHRTAPKPHESPIIRSLPDSFPNMASFPSQRIVETWIGDKGTRFKGHRKRSPPKFSLPVFPRIGFHIGVPLDPQSICPPSSDQEPFFRLPPSQGKPPLPPPQSVFSPFLCQQVKIKWRGLFERGQALSTIVVQPQVSPSTIFKLSYPLHMRCQTQLAHTIPLPAPDEN